MSFEDVMQALVVRGKAMQDACALAPSGMISILGMEEADIQKVCDEVVEGEEVLRPANLNAPGQIVVSGHLSAIERSVEPFKAAGAKRAIPLKVAGAFHSPLMVSAARPSLDALNGLRIGPSVLR